MQENRTSARTKALLLVLITIAAVALLAGLFSGLDLLPSAEDYNQTINEQESLPPDPPTTAAPPPSGASEPRFTVDQGTVDVHTGPSTEYPLIGHVSWGRTFKPSGRTPGGDWLQFTWEGMDGWVNVQQLIVTDSDQLPVVRDIPPPPAGPPPPGPPPHDSSPSDPSTPGPPSSGPTGPPPPG